MLKSLWSYRTSLSEARCRTCCLLLAASFLAPVAHAQLNGVGAQPYMGWSSFSQQAIIQPPGITVMSEDYIVAQSNALVSTGLQKHGFNYVNLDAGWSSGSDQYGRPIWDASKFPHFLQMIQDMHAKGQKVGIYLNPGVGSSLVQQNLQIFNTQYHLQDIIVQPPTAGNSFGGTDLIDYSKPGSQEYINSIVDQLASWGIDFIKLDGVSPGSDHGLDIDNRGDVEAFARAIAQNGRPIWFTISWALDEDYLTTWQSFANARRIEGDVECEGGDCPSSAYTDPFNQVTEWPRILARFLDLQPWVNTSGPKLGWNDLDSLEVGNVFDTLGITTAEQQTAMTLWVMSNSPLYLGSDLTHLTVAGKNFLSNDEVIAVDRSGQPATQVAAGFTPIWVQNLGSGNYNVALFNLNDIPTRVSLPWKDLGFLSSTSTRDLWSHRDLGSSPNGFSAVIPGHGSRLLRVHGFGAAPSVSSQSYEAEDATFTGTTQVSDCSYCSGGKNLTFLGIGPNNNAFFNNVTVPRSGVYRMSIDSTTFGPRAFIINVNGGPDITLNSSGGGHQNSTMTIPVRLNKGVNSIKFGNPTSFPPDLDRIVIAGDGSEPYPDFQVYEAENATLVNNPGNVVVYCVNCSGASKAGNLGFATSIAFENVTVPATGYYNMEIDYLTQGVRTFVVNVNGGPDQQISVNSDTFNDSPRSTTMKVWLTAGVNQITLGNPSANSPDLDSIVISPRVNNEVTGGLLGILPGAHFPRLQLLP